MKNKQAAREKMERSLEILVGPYSRAQQAVVFDCGEIGALFAWVHEDETWHFRWVDKIVDFKVSLPIRNITYKEK